MKKAVMQNNMQVLTSLFHIVTVGFNLVDAVKLSKGN